MGYDSAPSPAMWVRVDLLRMGGGRQWTGVGGSSAVFRGALCAWAVGGRSVGSFCRSFTVLLGRYAVLLWLRVSGPVVGFVAWPSEGSR